MSEKVFVGQTHDGRTLSEDECRKIVLNITSAQAGTIRTDESHTNELLAMILPVIESEAAAKLDAGLAAEIKQIKRRTQVALVCLENEIKTAELDITKRKTGDLERSDHAFASNQLAHASANRLNELKQNEFIEKAKLLVFSSALKDRRNTKAQRKLQLQSISSRLYQRACKRLKTALK